MEKSSMHIQLLNFWASIKNQTTREDGQDLIEYALIVALIAFAATAGMSTLAAAINNTFGTIGNTLNSTI
jgi:pilus assembly protein Flp/PilA